MNPWTSLTETSSLRCLDADFKTEEVLNENRRIINEEVVPAYQMVKLELQALKGSAQFEKLSDTEEGKAYY